MPEHSPATGTGHVWVSRPLLEHLKQLQQQPPRIMYRFFHKGSLGGTFKAIGINRANLKG